WFCWFRCCLSAVSLPPGQARLRRPFVATRDRKDLSPHDSVGPGGEGLARTALELRLDGRWIEAACGEQHVAVEPEVGELLDQPLVALGRARERGLDPLLADLPRRRRGASVEQLGDVGALGPLPRALRYAAPEPRRE